MFLLGLNGITLSPQSQILGLWLKSFSVAIHVEATEHVISCGTVYIAIRFGSDFGGCG